MTWRTRGIGSRYLVYRLAVSERRTSASEGSLLPTPTTGDAKQSGSRNTPGSKAHSGTSLTDFARGDGGSGRLVPTPSAADYKGSSKPGQRRRQLSEKVAGYALNPRWVEWLMGFPLDWTSVGEEVGPRELARWWKECRTQSEACDYTRSATRSSRNSPSSSDD